MYTIPAIPAGVLQLPSRFVGVSQQVSGRLVTQGCKGILEFGLLNTAVSGKVSACRAVVDEPMLLEEGQGARVVASGEVDLGQPEGIIGVV